MPVHQGRGGGFCVTLYRQFCVLCLAHNFQYYSILRSALFKDQYTHLLILFNTVKPLKTAIPWE